MYQRRNEIATRAARFARYIKCPHMRIVEDAYANEIIYAHNRNRHTRDPKDRA